MNSNEKINERDYGVFASDYIIQIRNDKSRQ